ncbi:MAG: NAD(P)-dependent oxidoreductase [Crenarchaeota archaeon]|nr:NAD(P)-dependent oxidoreductase [Thermoproteota archaeon]
MPTRPGTYCLYVSRRGETKQMAWSNNAGFKLPNLIENKLELDEILSRPMHETVKAVSQLDGDILILGVSGKIGPTLARLVKRAVDEAGLGKRVIGASRFSTPGLREELEKAGVETVPCDLLEEDQLDRLPDASNVIYMVGRKFGTKEDSSLTWAVNTLIPAMISRRFRRSKIVVFSTGNVYPLVPVSSGGADESTPPDPVGEYAQSCLGRERMFEYACKKYGLKTTFLRLNYAVELRYGVLLDVAQKVFEGSPIDLRMGYVNVIWQGDVNNIAVRSLELCNSPPEIINVTGPDIVSVRWLAERFGEFFQREPVFANREMEKALLSNASKCFRLFGPPAVTLEQMMKWVAHWVVIRGWTLNKPTHFEVIDGRF